MNQAGYLKYRSNKTNSRCLWKAKSRVRKPAHLPVFFSTYRFPASLKATIALKNARSTAQRNTATGSMPIIPQMKAFLLLRRRATMSGRMWSVFFSRKSWGERSKIRNLCEMNCRATQVMLLPYFSSRIRHLFTSRKQMHCSLKHEREGI